MWFWTKAVVLPAHLPGLGEREVLSDKTLSVLGSFIVQELCESRGGRPGLSVLTSLQVSVDVKLY